jgi:hypothetical protein
LDETPVWRFDSTEHGKGLYHLFAMEFDRIWHRCEGSEMHFSKERKGDGAPWRNRMITVHLIKLTQEREAKPSSLNPVSARLRELDGGDRPLTIVSSDRDSQTVQFIEPDVLHRPGFAVGENHGLADKFSLRLLEHVEDRGHSELHRGHG